MTDHGFTVEFEHTGEKFEASRWGIESYSIDSSWLTPTDAFSFDIFWGEDRGAELRQKFRPLQPIKLYIDDTCQLIGRIDKTSPSGQSGAGLHVEGRDYLAMLVDGSVDPSLRFKKTQDLGDAILSITRPFGITTIFSGGFNLTRNILTGKRPYGGAPSRDFKAAKLDDFKPDEGDGAYQVAEKLAARHGFMLQPAGSRDAIVLAEPEYRQAPSYEFRRPGNVLSAGASRDYSDVPTVTIATGRAGEAGGKVGAMQHMRSAFGDDAISAIGKNAEVKAITGFGTAPAVINFRIPPTSEVVAGLGGLLYRPLYYKDKDSRNQEQLERGLKREISERLRKTLEYTVTMRGHSHPDTGAYYAIDTIADVKDGIDDVNEQLWVYERRMSNSGQGPMTELKMVRPESYVL
jgi:prophage tail gpP-like protein